MIIIDYNHIAKTHSAQNLVFFFLPFSKKMIHTCMLWILNDTLQVTCGIVETSLKLHNLVKCDVRTIILYTCMYLLK